MTDKGKRRSDLTDEELELESAGELPDREALSVLDANIAIPADPSIAADVLAGEDPLKPDPDPEPEPEPDPEARPSPEEPRPGD